MSEAIWNAWKMTTYGFLLVGATALVTTLVMGYRADREDVRQTWAASRANVSAWKAGVPTQQEVADCRAYAQQGTEDKTIVVSKDLGSRGVVGAGVGAARHDAQYQAAYRSCMRQKGY